MNKSSMTVVEGLPRLVLKPSQKELGGTTITVDGIPGTIAMEIPWGPIIDVLVGLLKKGGGGGSGGGGGGDGCTHIKITNPDGSTTEITQCPPPK